MSVRLGEVSAYGTVKLQCLFWLGTMVECPLRRGVRLWDSKTAVFILLGIMVECPFRRGVRLWDSKTAVFILAGDHG